MPVPSRPVDISELPDRLRRLYAQVLARGVMSTQDHMDATGVSHRTSLRDFQQLVACGLVDRVGSRRGARYRPTSPGG